MLRRCGDPAEPTGIIRYIQSLLLSKCRHGSRRRFSNFQQNKTETKKIRRVKGRPLLIPLKSRYFWKHIQDRQKISTSNSSSNVRQRTESAVKDTTKGDCLRMYYIATMRNLRRISKTCAKSLPIYSLYDSAFLNRINFLVPPE